MKTLLTAALSLCTACAKQPMSVSVTTASPSVEMIEGANAWSEVGVTASYDAGADLAVTIELRPRLYNRDGNKVNGTTDRDSLVILIDDRLTGDALRHVVAHELAHAVMEVDHLTVGSGVMSVTPSDAWIVTPTEADYALACDAGYCR